MKMRALAQGVGISMSIGIASLSCGERSKEQVSSSSTHLSEEEARLVAQLQSAEATGRLDDLELEYWIGGGLPPPHHRSDQLRFLLLDGKPTIELNVETNDEKRPGLAMIEHRAPLVPDELRAVAKLIRETAVFSRRYPEENKPDVADILHTEVVLMSGDRSKSAKRTYYKSPPTDLEALTGHMKRISDRLRAEGQKRYLDREGKELP